MLYHRFTRLVLVAPHTRFNKTSFSKEAVYTFNLNSANEPSCDRCQVLASLRVPINTDSTMYPYHVPSIHLSDISLNPQVGHTRNMNLGAEMQRRTSELSERRVRRAEEGTESDVESDDDYYQDRDDRGVDRRDYDYDDRRTRHDLPDAVFFRRDQDDLEIAHIERRVASATRALEEAKRDLNETKIRIRNRRREERQLLNERSRVSHSVPANEPFLDDERVGALPSGDIAMLTDF